MREQMFSSGPAYQDTFQVEGVPGTVVVWFGRVLDVREAGYDALFGRRLEQQDPALLARLAGFPAILVRVETSGQGYRNWFGWIQFVRESAVDGSNSKVELDPIWYLKDKDVPFAAMGYCPTFFDAPSRAGRGPILWEADLYLCSVPGFADPELSTDLAVRPLAGVRWGFRIPIDGGDPELSFPRGAPREAWPSHSTILSARFPRWEFQS